MDIDSLIYLIVGIIILIGNFILKKKPERPKIDALPNENKEAWENEQELLSEELREVFGIPSNTDKELEQEKTKLQKEIKKGPKYADIEQKKSIKDKPITPDNKKTIKKKKINLKQAIVHQVILDRKYN